MLSVTASGDVVAQRKIDALIEGFDKSYGVDFEVFCAIAVLMTDRPDFVKLLIANELDLQTFKEDIEDINTWICKYLAEQKITCIMSGNGIALGNGSRKQTTDF